MDEAPTARRVLTPRWVLVHVAVVILVVTFLLLGWWQFGRAASGNLLSYGYAVQWPAFAAFLVYVWIKEMRGVLTPPAAAQAPPRPVPPPPPRPPATGNRRPAVAWDDAEDEELAAYNHYLAWLNANPHQSPSKYPGRSKESR